MRPQLARYAAILVFGFGAACVHPTGESSGRPDRNLITKEQLTANHYATVYDAVESLRGNWLKTRGADSFQSPSQVQVYFDNTRYGGIESMRNIATNTISFVRW